MSVIDWLKKQRKDSEATLHFQRKLSRREACLGQFMSFFKGVCSVSGVVIAVVASVFGVKEMNITLSCGTPLLFSLSWFPGFFKDEGLIYGSLRGSSVFGCRPDSHGCQILRHVANVCHETVFSP